MVAPARWAHGGLSATSAARSSFICGPALALPAALIRCIVRRPESVKIRLEPVFAARVEKYLNASYEIHGTCQRSTRAALVLDVDPA